MMLDIAVDLNDDGWAQYYVVVGNNDEKQLSQDEWAPFMQKA